MDPDTEATRLFSRPRPRGRLRRRFVGIAGSIALHLVLLAALWSGRMARSPVIRTIDIEAVPLAPEAEALAPEQPPPPPVPPPPVIDPPPEEPPSPPPEAPQGEGVAAVDAGVDAAQVAAVDAGVDAAQVAAVDAGVDAAQVAAVDAGVDAAQVAAVDAGADATAIAVAVDAGSGGTSDAAAVATSGDGGTPIDGGAEVAASDPDLTGDPAARPSSGTTADLIGYYPPGHVVSVLIRLDRLRGTAWADQINSVLRPLPDTAALLGGRDVKLTDQFDSLSFSSSQPRNVLATIVVAHTSMAPAALRDFLDSPEAPVSWSAARGGALGRRRITQWMFPGDSRVFLLWRPGWGVLAAPGDLGELTMTAPPGDLDQLVAAPGDLPPWLAQVSSIEEESGHPSGPAIMVTAAGAFPRRIVAPIGTGTLVLPGPESVTVTLELAPSGFLIKGNARYADDALADVAAQSIMQARADLLDDTLIVLVLRQVRAYNAIHGLSVKRTGRRLAFATSISTADGLALMRVVRRRLENYFQRPPSGGP